MCLESSNGSVHSPPHGTLLSGGSALAFGSINGSVLGRRRLVFGGADGVGVTGSARRTNGRATGSTERAGGPTEALTTGRTISFLARGSVGGTTGRANTAPPGAVDVATFGASTGSEGASVLGEVVTRSAAAFPRATTAAFGRRQMPLE